MADMFDLAASHFLLAQQRVDTDANRIVQIATGLQQFCGSVEDRNPKDTYYQMAMRHFSQAQRADNNADRLAQIATGLQQFCMAVKNAG
jgi:hypothetical protein